MHEGGGGGGGQGPGGNATASNTTTAPIGGAGGPFYTPINDGPATSTARSSGSPGKRRRPDVPVPTEGNFHVKAFTTGSSLEGQYMKVWLSSRLICTANFHSIPVRQSKLPLIQFGFAGFGGNGGSAVGTNPKLSPAGGGGGGGALCNSTSTYDGGWVPC